MSGFRTMQIDIDVHKCIEQERRSFDEAQNDILRRLLKLVPAAPSKPEETTQPAGRPWISKGITLPHGTLVRMSYNSKRHEGIIQDGMWLVEGRSYGSPSGAAGGVAATKSGKKTNLDGWNYWEAKKPNQKRWVSIDEMRNENIDDIL